MSVFILKNLCKSFATGKQQNVVLKNINLEFPEKGFFSIVGKSGCGKSTLLNILMGIEKPTSGEVHFNGKNISKMTDKAFSSYHLQGVSLVFQHYNLFNDLTCYENVILPLEIAGKSHDEIKQKAEELFKHFHLEYLIKRKAKNLSGGEKQRIAILRSLITDPVAILCDEPTGALDYQNSREIIGILKEISQKKLVIMVSHNKQLVDEFSDYVLTLNEGKIIENYNSKFRNNSFKKEYPKYHYSSKWSKRFLKINLRKNIKKNIFSAIACILSFSAMFISVGFSEGSKRSQDEALMQNLSIGFATATESEFIELEGSPLLYEKTIKPSAELIDKYFYNFKSIRCEENISYFISNYPSCYYDERKIDNFEMIPLFDTSLNSYGKDMIVKGNVSSDNFDEVIVNEEFDSLLGGNSVNQTIIISNESFVNYQTGDEKLPFIKETLSFSRKFRVAAVVHEFSFLNSPKLYFSYNGAKEFLKNEMMENVSNFLGYRFTYFDYLENCKNDDSACSYSSYLFVTDINEINDFFNKIKTLNNEPLQVTSKALETKDTYGTFISSFSSTLIIFVIIAFIGINFILGMISLSTFLENKKNAAILTCLGARNKSIYNFHLIENFLVIIFSFICSIFVSIFLGSKLNEIIYSKFSLQNLISIPFKNYLGIPFGLVILLGLIAIICSTIFTMIPMMIYRHNSITDELRDE
ncbi:MAG: ABC transporter ATP-binding protein/permease [Firmicutes bacterium]|nr:ABC transporter ATP-binding protein/permease [Candidatus Fiminaster equi]